MTSLGAAIRSRLQMQGTDPKPAEQVIADRLIQSGRIAEEAGRLAEACAMYGEAASAAPNYAPAHLNLGIGLEASGDSEGARRSYERALDLAPGNPFVNYNLGKLLFTQGDSVRAAALLRAALELKPAFVEASVLLADLLETQGDLPGAAMLLERALSYRPDFAGALVNYAVVLDKLNRPAESRSALRHALTVEPANVEVLQALARLAERRGDLAEAEEFYAKACAERPDLAEPYWHIGNVLADQGRLEEASARYRQALAIRPDFSAARHSQCMLLGEQDRGEDAIACLRLLLQDDPGFAPGHLSLGNMLNGRGMSEAAANCYRQALALNPGLAQAHVRLAGLHRARDEVDQSAACFRDALAIDPENVEARWAMAMSRLRAICSGHDEVARSRTDFSRALTELDGWIDDARLAACVSSVGDPPPFYLAYHEQPNRDILRAHGTLCCRVMQRWLDGQRLPVPERAASRDKIRIGVVSAHLQNHSVWNALVKGWFQHIDRSRFEIEAFCLGAETDEETRRAQALATHFERGGSSLHHWAKAIVARRPDVLIYPEIGMDPLTVKLASMRLAPLQAAAWGHPETTGMPSIDYFISAEELEPAQADGFYSERLIRLPHLGCSYSPRTVVPEAIDMDALGLGGSAPILLCPGTPYKYTPRHDRLITDIAADLGECRFVFFSFQIPELSTKLHRRLRAAFEARGLDCERMVKFIPWQSPAAFRGLMLRAHVFLDTCGFSGFNTAMEAVECGLPIVARQGQFMRGRLASAILVRLGLHELVAHSDAEYVALAVRTCRDAGYRRQLGARIEAARPILFDDQAPVRALEEFLMQAARRH